mgnify:CR=1 FL=1|jgi:hypothetical protein
MSTTVTTPDADESAVRPVVRPFQWFVPDFHPYEEFPRTLLERTEWEDPLDR